MKRIICLACLTLVMTACSSSNPDQAYKFTFKPPDSVSFVVELSMIQASGQGDQRNLDSTWTRTAHIQRSIAGGYELAGKTDSVLVFHNGVIVNQPLVRLFAGGDITMQLDTAGAAIGVRGFEELLGQLDTLVGPDTAAMIRQMVSIDELRNQETTVWNDKFTPFVGREMKLGTAYCDTIFQNLPVEGRLASYRITQMVDTVRIGDNLCGRLLVTSSTDPAELAKLSGKSEADVQKLFGLTPEAFTQAGKRQAGYSSTREWVLEFATMLSHTETSHEQAFYFDLSQSGMPVRSEMSQSHDKRFVYSDVTKS